MTAPVALRRRRKAPSASARVQEARNLAEAAEHRAQPDQLAARLAALPPSRPAPRPGGER